MATGYLGKTDGRNDNKRQRPGSSDDDCSAYLCQKCDESTHDKITCTCCKLHYCLRCAKITALLYQCIRNNELENFHWTCQGCKAMFPSLENISGTLKDIQVKHERRMTLLEGRMDKLEFKTIEEVKSSVSEMKEGIVTEIKEDINKLVDQRNRELEDRRRREMNLVIFNLKEHTCETGRENKQKDEQDFLNICSSLGLEEALVETSYRLGRRSAKPRPLKVILTSKGQRKYLIDNAKFIPEKAPQYKDVIVTKDLTPVQRDEKRQYIQRKKGSTEPKQSVRNIKKVMNTPQEVNQNLGTPVPMEFQSLPLSPIPSHEPLSQINMLNDSRPLESTCLTQQYEASTIVLDKTDTDKIILGGLTQENKSR